MYFFEIFGVKCQNAGCVVKYRDRQKYICYEGQLTFQSFLDCVSKKFNILSLDLKIFDESKTEVDEEVFEFLIKKQDLGVLEIRLPQGPDSSDSWSFSTNSSFASSSGENEGDCDDTIILQHSPGTRKRAEDNQLAQIEDILKNKPGGERIINEYTCTKSLTDSRRHDMVKILVAHMTSEYGTSPSRRVRGLCKGHHYLVPILGRS
ncbi:uncharacterized protein LOC108897101 [Lates calcarifer]|uniref:Uncharacterized protein LOC108897101 n=1 Tax=Lates calcarifer TaxID=8187 RepID=A0AAJ7VG34_LATCA|nr:uncharacterized protein LOC108897101 [Lates calcarifer]